MIETARTRAWRAMSLVLAAVLAAGVAAATEKAEKKGDNESRKKSESAGLTVERWLVAGPEATSLPAFHDAEDGGVVLKDILGSAVLPVRPWYPAEGGAVVGDSDAFPWRAEMSGGKGLVQLETERDGLAEAWLAVYLTADRFRDVEVEITGTHPRRGWVDGEPLAQGGTSAPDDRVKGNTALTSGKHVLVVLTMRDPERNEPWRVGAVVRPKPREKEKEKGGDEGKGTGSGDPWPEGAKAADVFTLDPERNLTILDILDPPGVDSFALSPQGRLAAMVVERVRPGSADQESWIEIRRARDGSPERTFRGAPGMKQVEWIPGEGRRLSYVTTEDKKTTLWAADLDAGTTVPVLEKVENWGGYEWSPRGDLVVFDTSVEPEKNETGIKRLAGIQDRWATFRTKSFLHALVPGGVPRRLTAGPETTSFTAFSPDGTRLLFTRQLEDLSARPYSRSELWEMELKTGESRKLVEIGWLSDAVYSPDGRKILVRSGPSAFGDAGSVLPAESIPNDYDGQLYIYEPASGAVEAITRDFDPSVQDARWHRADGAIYVRAEDGDYVRLYRYRPEAGEFEALDTGLEVVRDFALADRTADVLLVRGTSVWEPQRVVALEPGSGEVLWTHRPADRWFEHVRRGEVRPWSFVSSEGRTIDGRVYLPTDFDPERRYPALVYFYGGTSPVNRAFGGRYPKEWWASHGYVVYVLQPSGATGYGQEFAALHVNDWGNTTAREIVEGTEKFLEAHPFVDPVRVGCLGASYGGFMTMRVITETDRFAAAVAHAGISALSSYWGEGYWGYAYGAVANAESFPWNRRDLFVDGSPLFRADKVKTPVLLTHGAADTNVPPGESDQFYIALRLLGVPVEYLQVEGQNHLILEHDKRVRWSESIVAWFDRWLNDDPAWWNHLYP